MSTSKIKFKVGHISFIGEGEAEWLAKQMDKIILHASSLSKIPAPKLANPPATDSTPSSNPETFTDSLVKHLKEKDSKSAAQKFLVTADWLRRKGKDPISTSDVTSALKENQQSRLSNASQALNDNVSKGFCQKDGNGFFITQEGKEHLGYK